MQAKRVLFAWHSHKVVVFCSCAVFRCLTMQLASVKVTRERGALLSPALVVEGGRALLALSAQRSVVCIGWCSHGACWHSIAPRSESLEVAAAHVHQSNLCNHTTTHFKHTLISSQLSPLLRSLQMAFRRVLGAPALGAAARCAVTTTPRAWQSKVRCVSPPLQIVGTMSGVS